jgi:hypothetical protein
MHVEPSLLTTNWFGDVLIIAGGVFVGNAVWGFFKAIGEWPAEKRHNRERASQIDDLIEAVDSLAASSDSVRHPAPPA